MGYYQMGVRRNTQANHKDTRYIDAFDRLRDMEYTVGQSRCYAEDAVKIMNEHPHWTVEQALRVAFK